MKKTTYHRDSAIDSAHVQGGAKPPHDREQLRKRLLQMILKSEAERRAAQIPAGRARKPPRAETTVDLVVFDPENLLGRELASGSSPKKRA